MIRELATSYPAETEKAALDRAKGEIDAFKQMVPRQTGGSS